MSVRLGSRDVFPKVDPYVRAAGRRVLEVAPWLEEPLSSCRGWYIHGYVRYVQWRHNRRHAAPIDPYRIAWVDPDRVEYLAEPARLPRFRLAGAVQDGDWDRYDRRFTDMDVYEGFVRRFEDGRDWEETAFFQRVLQEVRQGSHPWGCSSREELEERCERLDRLFETIAEVGFRTQRELLEDDVEDPIGSRRRSKYCRLLNDEIAVDVGRDGELLFVDGRNRFSIAKILDVDAVPVMILRRHAEWVAFRDRVAEHVQETGVLPEAVEDHPDLQQLASE